MENKLNKEQIEAIKYTKGPLLIIAGAGTGKTTVVTQKIKYLIKNNLAKPEEILALTFTQKAAQEMENRVDEITSFGQNNVFISTFHGFCDKVLKDEGLQIGIDTSYKLLSYAESVGLLKDNLFEINLNYFRPRGNPGKFIEGLISHFDRLKDENISPIEYLKWARNYNFESDLDRKKYTELANIYKFYEEIKSKNSLADFGDLIFWTLELFKKRPNVLRDYQKKFKYILVDEFQDTNFAQSQLVYKLTEKHKKITVVGDDDQSIYRFRGASISNILDFRKHFPEAKIVVLGKNYRSNQEILDKAYNLIQFNNPDRLEFVEKINKKLVARKKGNKNSTNLITYPTDTEETYGVADEILKLKKAKGYSYSDFAVLSRSNAQAAEFAKTFGKIGIPYTTPGSTSFFEDPHVSSLTSLLKVLVNPFDDLNLYRFFSLDELSISSLEILKLIDKSKRSDESLFEIAQKNGTENIQKALGSIEANIEKSKNIPSWQLLYEFMTDLKILNKFLEDDSWEAQIKIKNTAKFLENLKIYEEENPNAGLHKIVDWLELASRFGMSVDEDWEEDSVRILTAHASKGLEFSVVFITNLVELRFPATAKPEQIPLPLEIVKEVLPQGDYHLQEERRLFYVAMTRAKDKLYFTSAIKYKDNKRPKKISKFVKEALGEVQPTSEIKSKIELTPQKRKSQIKINYLSYSQIEAFKICPLHYRLRYLVGLKTPQTPSESLGISIHSTIKSFYEYVGNGKAPTENLMNSLLSQNWIHEGYESKKFEKISLERAKDYLIGYLENSFSVSKRPLYLEKKFSKDISIGSSGVKIGGVIDRIDDLGNGVIEIVDYKTSENIPSQKDVDKNEQLTMYALMLDRDPKDIVLSLYFFDQQIKISTKRSKAQLENYKKEILDIKSQIENSDFLCSGHYFCRDCEYLDFCKFSH